MYSGWDGPAGSLRLLLCTISCEVCGCQRRASLWDSWFMLHPHFRERNKMAPLRARGGAKNRHSKRKIAAEIEWKNTVSRLRIIPLQFRYHVGFYWNCFIVKYLHIWWDVNTEIWVNLNKPIKNMSRLDFSPKLKDQNKNLCFIKIMKRVFAFS